jgi:hypothetical protein
MKQIIFLIITLCMAELSQAQWEPDVRLTYDGHASQNYSHQGIASSGDTVHVVWFDDRNENQEIYYKRSTDRGLTWGEDVRLTNNYYNSWYVSIAVSGSIVHVLWSVDVLIGNYETFYKRSLDGGSTWGFDNQLTFTPGITSGNCISVSGSKVHVVYYDNCDGWWEVYYKQSADGGSTWKPDVRLTYDPAVSGNTAVCAAGSLVHVVWEEQRDGNREIYYKRSGDEGMTWGEDTRITDNDSLSRLPCVGASGQETYIIWQDYRDGDFEIYFKHSPDEGLTWEEDTRLTDYPGYSIFPNLTVSGTGLCVVWADDRDGNPEIYYKYSSDGGINWGEDTRLTDDTAVSNFPSVSVSGSQVNVTWSDDRDGNSEIYYKRDPTGNFPVGLEEEPLNASDGQFFIFTNPASRQLAVRSSQSAVGSQQSAVGGQQCAFRIIIANIQGQVLKELGNISSFPYQIDISNLKNGLYILQVISEDGRRSAKKFIKIGE